MLLQQLVNGLTIGSIYALVALGYTLIYGVLSLINFAHGDVFMMGAFFSFVLVSILNINPILAFFLAAILGGILGIIIELLAFKPIRNGARSSQLISSIGVSIVLENIAMLAWGSNTKPFPQVTKVNVIKLSQLYISTLQIEIFSVSIILMFILYFFIYKTRIGIAMRATSQDGPTTSLMGINTNKIISLTFGVGSLLGSAAGILVGLYYNSIVFNMGYDIGLKAFIAAILGGIGNIPGTMFGGILLGLAECFGAVLISAKYKNVFSFIILILVLLFKPTGLFGKKGIEKV